jgi:hypothetical protein
LAAGVEAKLAFNAVLMSIYEVKMPDGIPEEADVLKGTGFNPCACPAKTNAGLNPVLMPAPHRRLTPWLRTLSA